MPQPEPNPEYRPVPARRVPLPECPAAYQDIFRSFMGVNGIEPGRIDLDDDDVIWGLVDIQPGMPIPAAVEEWRAPVARFAALDLYTGPVSSRRDVFRRIVALGDGFWDTVPDQRLRFSMEQHFRHYMSAKRG